MPELWVPFKYYGFWDVPRYIIISFYKCDLYLTAEFNDALDDYETEYSGYLLPKNYDHSIDVGWRNIKANAIKILKSIPVDRVKFAPSRRKTVEIFSLGLEDQVDIDDLIK